MYFKRIQDQIYWEDIHLSERIHQIRNFLDNEYNFSGPFFLYHKDILHDRIKYLFGQLKGHSIYFSVKSLSNIHILKEVHNHANIGVDVVSKGEIIRAKKAGFTGENILFAGAGKTDDELEFAIQNNIKSFHVESISELKKIQMKASETGRSIKIALRINPNISIGAHEYIKTSEIGSKFGIDLSDTPTALKIISSTNNLTLIGLHIHLGSQIMTVEPYRKALLFLFDIAKNIEKEGKIDIQYISLGGGFGIDYSSIFKDQKCEYFPLNELLTEIKKEVHKLNAQKYQIFFEPGRFLTAPIGILVCSVSYIKSKPQKDIIITNAGITELLRPALYGAEHPVLNLTKRSSEKKRYDIVGPICENSDFLAKNIKLEEVKENDTLIILYCGAYSSVMNFNYNTRPLIPEVLVDKNTFRIIRRPQKIEDILSLEL